MVMVRSLGSIQRTHDGIMIHLRQDEWADDVSLPKDAVVFETGDGPFYPYWRVMLQPNQTVELLVGWFKVPCSLDQLVAWYQTEMEKMGWVKSKSFREGNSAGINFQSPDKKIHVEISILDRPDLGDSTAMIRRVVKHPYAPPKANGAAAKRRAGAQSQKRRRQTKASSRVVA